MAIDGTRKAGRWSRHVLAVILAIVGIPLVIGGTLLVGLGGSAYYVLSGFAILVIAVVVERRSGWAPVLYAALCALTLCWSLWEVGFDPWQLVPRLVAP